MPLMTTAKCDRCETTLDASDHNAYLELKNLGWVTVRLHGWTDLKGNQTKPEAPNEWLVCPSYRADLVSFFDERDA